MSRWVQSGEKVYVLGEDGELKARVCVASSMERAKEITQLRQACVDGLCRRARVEFVRRIFAGMAALGTNGSDATKACVELGVTAKEAEEAAKGAT